LKNANPNSPVADRDADTRTGAASPGRTPQIPLAIALIGGAFFAAAGLLVYAALLDVLPGKPLVFNAPRAIIWLAGSIFFCAGIGIAVYRFLPRIAAACSLIAVLAFVATFNWIAFGPGERNFTKSTSAGAGSASTTKTSKASETEGRIVFGLVAGLFDALILYGLYRSIRSHKGRAGADKPATHTAGRDGL
jgi:hypothetical protein